ncbi:hypothetical protein ALP23_100186 [Pseudomonas syringae pv. apii]|uniref:Uncharacterized protein n=1 Tax=Pseudomonas syringae pv. apii TaxID=81036 RepID=A0A3M5WDD1_9PSED|nr:hypothetical protein ALP85_100250 [Pseudomonas syringae pv. syringae]RMU68661.1 hypothetical protein ALP23_100186 [Pseudomonas syringae pv. apii]
MRVRNSESRHGGESLSARDELSACLANPGPMLLSGFLMPAIQGQASALSTASIRCNTSASPRSAQYTATSCPSASTL